MPVIQGVAGGKLNVSTTGSKGQKVVFEGPEPITFGVQAAALKFDADGNITAMNQIAAGSASLGLRAKPSTKTMQAAPRLVKTTARFIEIG